MLAWHYIIKSKYGDFKRYALKPHFFFSVFMKSACSVDCTISNPGKVKIGRGMTLLLQEKVIYMGSLKIWRISFDTFVYGCGFFSSYSFENFFKGQFGTVGKTFCFCRVRAFWTNFTQTWDWEEKSWKLNCDWTFSEKPSRIY